MTQLLSSLIILISITITFYIVRYVNKLHNIIRDLQATLISLERQSVEEKVSKEPLSDLVDDANKSFDPRTNNKS